MTALAEAHGDATLLVASLEEQEAGSGETLPRDVLRRFV